MRPMPDAMRPRSRPRPERVRPWLRPRPNDLASRPHGPQVLNIPEHACSITLCRIFVVIFLSQTVFDPRFRPCHHEKNEKLHSLYSTVLIRKHEKSETEAPIPRHLVLLEHSTLCNDGKRSFTDSQKSRSLQWPAQNASRRLSAYT